MPKTTKEAREDAVLRVKSGEWTQAEAARALKITKQAMAKTLRRAGVPVTKVQAPKLTDAERAEVVRLFVEDGLTAGAIATQIQRSKAAVHTVLHANALNVDAAAGKLRRVAADRRAAAVAAYLSGLTVTEVAEKLDLSSGIVYNELRRKGVRLRRRCDYSRFSDQPEARQRIITGYQLGCSVALLACVYHCSANAIKKVLRDARVELRKEIPGQRGFQFTDRKGREHWMRSTWELQTAAWLDRQERDWDYEKETYLIAERPARRYTPDFWIYDGQGQLERIVDVKGWLYEDSAERIRQFRERHPTLPFEMWGQEQLKALGVLDEQINIPMVGRAKIRSRLSKDEIQKISGLYSLGRTVSQIAVELQRSESAVEAVVRKLGLSRGKAVSKRMNSASAELRQQIADTYLAGNSITATAALLSVSRDVVIGEIGRRGIARSRAAAQQSAYAQGRGRWQQNAGSGA